MADTLLVGLMSGTSVDAIDAALVRIDRRPSAEASALELLDCLEYPMPPALRDQVQQLSHSGNSEIEHMGELDRKLGQCFAQATLDLLAQAGVDRGQIKAIGSHGQTIRHHPPSTAASGSLAYTLQIGDPNTIAEITGITTVADFRRRDIAAGGEGAPLVPAFHAELFSHPEKNRAIVNIGGIANITLLPANGSTSGFDCGPGNTLLDHWIHEHRGQHYDANGAWSAEGKIDIDLLQSLLAEPYLDLPPPKSTGKELFNPAWLEARLAGLPTPTPGDVQATLCELTAAGISKAVLSAQEEVQEVYVCGGGAANDDLMRRLYQQLDGIYLGTTAELGCDPAWVEAAAFAWLALRRIEGKSGSLAAATGAEGNRVLGAIYPG